MSDSVSSAQNARSRFQTGYVKSEFELDDEGRLGGVIKPPVMVVMPQGCLSVFAIRLGPLRSSLQLCWFSQLRIFNIPIPYNKTRIGRECSAFGPNNWQMSLKTASSGRFYRLKGRPRLGWEGEGDRHCAEADRE